MRSANVSVRRLGGVDTMPWSANIRGQKVSIVSILKAGGIQLKIDKVGDNEIPQDIWTLSRTDPSRCTVARELQGLPDAAEAHCSCVDEFVGRAGDDRRTKDMLASIHLLNL